MQRNLEQAQHSGYLREPRPKEKQQQMNTLPTIAPALFVDIQMGKD
jgi:hypothetical protein